MYRFQVELIGSGRDLGLLSYLAQCLRESSCRITEDVYGRYLEEEDGYFLLSSDFEAMKTEAEVAQSARELLYVLNGIVKLKFDVNDFVRSGTVYDMVKRGLTISFDSDGDEVTTTANGQVRDQKETATRRRVRTLAQSFQTRDMSHPPTAVEIWHLARNHDVVKRALRYYYLSMANLGDRSRLFKVYEEICGDTGVDVLGIAPIQALLPRRWRSRTRDFEQSAHSAHWSDDDARLSLARSQRWAGVVPMSWQEAKDFMDHLFLRWLQSK